jgi:hypothetical protein
MATRSSWHSKSYRNANTKYPNKRYNKLKQFTISERLQVKTYADYRLDSPLIDCTKILTTKGMVSIYLWRDGVQARLYLFTYSIYSNIVFLIY